MPKTKRRNHVELKLQQQCYVWFHNTYPDLRRLLWRIENEGRRTGFGSMIAKSTGITPGVADMNFLYHGVLHAIEVKAPGGSQSKEQKEWQSAVEKHGAVYLVADSLEKFQHIIRSITENRPIQS